MKRTLTLILLILPGFIYSEEKNFSGLLQIDIVVKVVAADSEELWSVDFTKYTVKDRSISINLHGFDGELTAVMTPIYIDNKIIIMNAGAVVRELDSDNIIQKSSMKLEAAFGEKIILYPMGDLPGGPDVVMELNIIKLNGVNP